MALIYEYRRTLLGISFYDFILFLRPELFGVILGLRAILSRVFSHPSSVSSGFHLIEYTLVKSNIDCLLPQALHPTSLCPSTVVF